MKPEKALELVGRYSRLTKEIKSLGPLIGDNIEKCKGFSGVRGEFIDGSFFELKHQPEYDNKNRSLDVHLHSWYKPELGEVDGEPGYIYQAVDETYAEKCPHCYAAHLLVQRRKAAKRELASTKAAMTRGGT